MTNTAELVKNADGDDFTVWFDPDLKEWRAEQWSGLHKNYLNLPAMLHAKSKRELLSDLGSHRCAS